MEKDWWSEGEWREDWGLRNKRGVWWFENRFRWGRGKGNWRNEKNVERNRRRERWGKVERR